MAKGGKALKGFAREGFLIIVSILVALGVNEWRIHIKQQAELRDAVVDIHQELADNLALIDGTADYQRRVAQAIAQQAEGELLDRTPMDVMLTVVRSVAGEKNSFVGIDGAFQNVSWEIAKDRGVVARMDYDTAKRISFVSDTILPGLMTFYIDVANSMTSAKLHIPRDQRATLLELSGRMQEAAGRTEYLEEFIVDAQDALRADYPDLIGPISNTRPDTSP